MGRVFLASRHGPALVAAALLAGCHMSHVVVLNDGAPLYAAPAGPRVLAHLPRLANAPLDEAPDPDAARVALAYGGRAGWADRGDVRVFEYLDPDLDGGEDRERVVRRELRELLLADQGRGWSPEVLAAIRDDEVLAGMTRPQVELAWGWPLTVEALGGGERWIYRSAGTRPVRRWANGPWLAGRGQWCHPWGVQPLWLDPRDDWMWSPTWVVVELPVTIERAVEFDARGRVVGTTTKQILD